MTHTHLTPDELVARYEGRISLRTLRRWRDSNAGPPWFQAGRRFLYPLKGLEKWEATRPKGDPRKQPATTGR